MRQKKGESGIDRASSHSPLWPRQSAHLYRRYSHRHLHTGVLLTESGPVAGGGRCTDRVVSPHRCGHRSRHRHSLRPLADSIRPAQTLDGLRHAFEGAVTVDAVCPQQRLCPGRMERTGWRRRVEPVPLCLGQRPVPGFYGGGPALSRLGRRVVHRLLCPSHSPAQVRRTPCSPSPRWWWS
jgi:hypothetical protein